MGGYIARVRAIIRTWQEIGRKLWCAHCQRPARQWIEREANPGAERHCIACHQKSKAEDGHGLCRICERYRLKQ